MAKTLSEYTQTIHSSMTDIRGTLTELTEEDCSNIKLKDVNEKLGKISTGNKLNINITADDYEGATFTATHSDQETKATGVVSQKKTTITVPKGGSYTVTNTDDEQSQEATLIDNVDLEFLKFSATIKVTIPEDLVGETITCSLSGGDLQEQKAETTTVTFTVRKKGNWTIGVKGFTQITASVDVQDKKEYTTSLTVDPARVASIIVKSKTEDNGKTIKCTKDQTVLQKVLKDRKCTFILPETGEWKITCDDFPEIIKTVNVSELKVYNCTYRADVFGIRVKQSESDPKQRIEPLEDLVGLRSVTVNAQNGTVDYGDMEDTFLFRALNHCVLKSIDKSEEIELNPNDYSKKLEGGNAPAAGATSNYNTFARADKLYIYEYSADGYEYYYISEDKIDDNYEPIGFYTANGEADHIYMATYLGSFDSQNRLRSISGVKIRNNTTYTDFYDSAQRLGTDYHMETHAHINLYEIAYLMMFQNDNSQTALGQGRPMDGDTNGSSKVTDTVTTGFANNKGPIAYDTSSKAIKFMHIEDFWFNGGCTIEEGICSINGKTYVKMKPPYPIKDANGDKSSYTEVTGSATKSGYISASIASNKWGRIPSATSGSQNTYQCGSFYAGSSSEPTTLYFYMRAHNGLWHLMGLKFAQNSWYEGTARLSLIPS